MLVNLVDFELPVQQAIEAPRFALDAKPNSSKPGAGPAMRWGTSDLSSLRLTSISEGGNNTLRGRTT